MPDILDSGSAGIRDWEVLNTRDRTNMAAVLVQRFPLSRGLPDEKWNAERTRCHSQPFHTYVIHAIISPCSQCAQWKLSLPPPLSGNWFSQGLAETQPTGWSWSFVSERPANVIHLLPTMSRWPLKVGCYFHCRCRDNIFITQPGLQSRPWYTHRALKCLTNNIAYFRKHVSNQFILIRRLHSSVARGIKKVARRQQSTKTQISIRKKPNTLVWSKSIKTRQKLHRWCLFGLFFFLSDAKRPQSSQIFESKPIN